MKHRRSTPISVPGRVISGVLVLGIALALFGGCAEESEPEPVVAPLSREEISGERLWQRISEEAPYETYSFWPGQEGVQPGQAPHGAFHSIYINRPLIEALPAADSRAPEGSIIVKESFDVDRNRSAFTVMAKVEGIAPESGDWFWAMYTPEGEVAVSGVLENCIECHAGMRANDYVIVQPLDQPLE